MAKLSGRRFPSASRYGTFPNGDSRAHIRRRRKRDEHTRFVLSGPVTGPLETNVLELDAFVVKDQTSHFAIATTVEVGELVLDHVQFARSEISILVVVLAWSNLS